MTELRAKIERLKEQIAAWGNRAQMARQQGNEELMRQALMRKRQYENELARLQEFDVDDV